MVTLMWGGMNMVNLKSLQGLDDGSFIHMFSYLLFGLHYCASMIVLLNMLIAMMSNSYQYIQVSASNRRRKKCISKIPEDM